MTILEIVLIIIGLIFIFGSFMVSEKLSPRDIEHLSDITRDGMNDIVNKGLETAKSKIDDVIDESIEESAAKVEREMEKESNDKVMYIQEYADGVLDEIHKTHEEVMFLYNMLNDKQDELKSSVSQAAVIGKQLREGSEQPAADAKSAPITQEAPLPKRVQPKAGLFAREAMSADASSELEQMSANAFTSDIFGKSSFEEELLEGNKKLELAKRTAVQIAQVNNGDSEQSNNNDKILELYKSGMSEKDIAIELGIGRGEVKLVLDLYKGARN